MATQIKILDVAQEIYDELENPSNTSSGAIAFWLLQNVGALNNLIDGEYALVDSGDEVTPLLGEGEKSIYKTMFYIYYYDKMIRTGLGASAFDSLLEVTSDGGTVRQLNRNEVAKTYIQMKKDEKAKLDQLVTLYRSKGARPIQVTGDDIYSSEPIISGPSYQRGRN